MDEKTELLIECSEIRENIASMELQIENLSLLLRGKQRRLDDLERAEALERMRSTLGS